MLRAMLLGLVAPLLAACIEGGTREPFETVTAGDALRAAVASRVGGGGAAEAESQAVDARRVLSAAVLAQVDKPVLLAIVREADRGVAMAPVGVGADGTVQWRDGTGAGLLLRGGVLVGTRGLGFDLLTVDDAGLRAALGAGGGRDVPRVERRLRGDNVVVAERLFCDVVAVGRERLDYYGRSHATTRFEERCAGDESAFVNTYWLGTAGLIRRQAVRVGPRAGVLETVVLRE